MEHFGVARPQSLVSATRYGLAVVFLGLFLVRSGGALFWLLPVAIAIELSDFADGWIARTSTAGPSTAGAILDSMADSFARGTEFLALGWAHLVPLWFVALVLWRDSLVILVRLLVAATSQGRYVPTPLSGKAKGLGQAALLLWLVATISTRGRLEAPTAHIVTSALLLGAALATAMSGASYLFRGRHAVWTALRYG